MPQDQQDGVGGPNFRRWGRTPPSLADGELVAPSSEMCGTPSPMRHEGGIGAPVRCQRHAHDDDTHRAVVMDELSRRCQVSWRVLEGGSILLLGLRT